MRTFLIAGNWKMNAGPTDAGKLAKEITSKWAGKTFSSEALLCPPYISIPAVQQAFDGTGFQTGAQNVYIEDDGAFTGEISTSMIKDAGCTYVIIGHSERREYFSESDEFIASKTKKTIDSGLKAILCVGEVLEERKSGNQEKVVEKQVNAVLNHLSADASDHFVIAYEPVWAIGTGETASPEQAQEMHKFIRSLVEKSWGKAKADGVRILYGGSMKPGNAKELLGQPDVDGGLIGGASLDADSYSKILEISESI